MQKISGAVRATEVLVDDSRTNHNIVRTWRTERDRNWWSEQQQILRESSTQFATYDQHHAGGVISWRWNFFR